MRPYPFGWTGRATRNFARPRPQDEESQRWFDGILRALALQQRRIATASALIMSLPSDIFWSQETALLTILLNDLATASANRGGLFAIDDVRRRFRVGIDWGLVNTEASAWATGRAVELATGLTDTTKAQARQVIGDWIASGEPIGRLASRLREQAGIERRAELIAGTESTNAFAVGNRIAWQKSGVVKREEWNTANDERVCPVCGPLNGKISRLGQGPRPAIHPGCRCWLTPVV